MDYVKLSIESLKEKSCILANMIRDDYKPELICYVAKGGFLIGKTISMELECPLVPVHAVRRGGGFKNKLAPLLVLLPQRVKYYLRQIELRSGIHKRATRRDVYMRDEDINTFNAVERILLVDDSVDTGCSIVSVKEYIKKFFPKASIKVAAINVWENSEELTHTNYTVYRNTIIATPMSVDSDEYQEFLLLYRNSLEK